MNEHSNISETIHCETKHIFFHFSHVERLPPANNYLLQHLLFILNKVAENHEVEFMEEITRHFFTNALGFVFAASNC